MLLNTRKAATAIATTLFALAGSAQAQTNVPAGGEEIDVGAGTAQVRLRLKNTTGERARDLTLAIYSEDGGQVPNFRTVDISGIGERLDDNGDGELQPEESDNRHDGAERRVAKSIFTDANVEDNGEITVLVELSGNTPAGTKIRAKFSVVEETDDGRELHWDINSPCVVFPGNYDCFLPMEPGAAQCVTDIVNDSQDWIYEVVVPVWPENPVIDIELPTPYDNSLVIPQPDVWIIQLDPPLPPQQEFGLYLYNEYPICDPFSAYQQPIFVIPGPQYCRADINEDGVVDTRDYLEYLNLFNQRDPYADWNNDGHINTLDFLAFQNDWTDCR